jgi:hypothetical protein
LADQLQCLLRLIAEHLEDMVDENSFGHMPGSFVRGGQGADA